MSLAEQPGALSASMPVLGPESQGTVAVGDMVSSVVLCTNIVEVSSCTSEKDHTADVVQGKA